MGWLQEFGFVRKTLILAASIVATVVVALASIAAVWFALLFFLPPIVSVNLEQSVTSALLWNRPIYAVPDRESDEDFNARQQIRYEATKIATRVMDCIGATYIDELPTTLQYRGDVSTYIFGNLSEYPGPGKVLQKHVDAEPLRLLSRVLDLSDSLTQQRTNFQRQSSKYYYDAQVAIFLQIAIVLLTTIIVSLNSADLAQSNPRISVTLRVLAIVFPASGTALTAVIAFYGPSAAYAGSQQALDGLTTLHRQLADNVYRLDCPTATKDSDANKKLSERLDLYEDQLPNAVKTASPAATNLQKQTENGSGGGPVTGNSTK